MHSDLHQQASAALELARREGADEAVANVSANQSTEFARRDGKLEKVQQSTSRGLYIRIYADERYSTHSTTDLRPDQVGRFIADAVALTRHLEPDPFRVIPDPTLYAGRSQVDLDLDDPAVRELERDICLEWLASMDASSHADSRVISATCEVRSGWGASAQMSTNGFEGTRSSTSLGYGNSVTLDGGDGRRPEAYRHVSGRHLADLPDPRGVADEGLERALRRLGSRKVPSERTTMVVDPEAGGGLARHLLSALSAGAIQQNRSFLADKLGRQIGGEGLTMVDDPLLVRGIGSQLYDGEGIAARAMPVIEGGVLRNYYVDTYYGKKLGWNPTTSSASNVVFAPGEKGLAELLDQASEGFYVTGWLGGNADATTGDFSFGFRGHRIDGGKAVSPVSEMNVTGNYLRLLENLVAVGNDPNPWSNVRTPTMVFRDVEFSGE